MVLKKVPKNWDDIRRIDAAAGNTKWADVVSKEVTALIQHEYFNFIEKSKFKPPSDFQNIHLHFVYEVKPDLRQRARLVCDGSRVDPRGLSTHATVVKGISVCLLNLIAVYAETLAMLLFKLTLARKYLLHIYLPLVW